MFDHVLLPSAFFLTDFFMSYMEVLSCGAL